MFFIVLVVFAGAALGQYPNMIYDTSISLNMCASDADCEIYVAQNASYPNLGLRCNPATSRCELNSGNAVGPAFDLTCPGISMSYIAWPSAGTTALTNNNNQAYLNDGIIIVTLSFSAELYEGILRLYDFACPAPYTACPDGTNFQNALSKGNITTTYWEQQYVNAPTTVFTFRNLPALTTDPTYSAYGGYGIAYFDKSGCTVLSPQLVVIESIYQPNYFGSAVVVPPTYPANTLTLPNVVLNVDRYGRTAQTGFLSPYYSTYRAPFFRCAFVQVFDMTGRVMYSGAAQNAIVTPGVFYGVTFPPTLPIFNQTLPTAYAYGALSGYVTLQLGIGYCSQPMDIPPVPDMINSLGVFEGIWAQSVTLTLSGLSPAPPPIPGFTTARMYTTLNLVQFNTYMLVQGFPDPFGPASNNNVDFSVVPDISVITNLTHQTFDGYSMCNSDYAIISWDYSGLNIPSNMPVGTLALAYVNLTDPNLSETYIAEAPIKALFVTGTFEVTTPGFYCLVMITNFVDGLGVRPVLRSCFQVGILAAAATQLRSYYNTGSFNVNFFPYTSYAGYGSFVQTEVYLYTPPYLVLTNDGLTAQVQLYRFSPDAFDEQQLYTYGATYADVFQDTLGDPLPFMSTYTAIVVGDNATVYRRNAGPFNMVQYPIFAYDGATDIIDVLAVTQLQVFHPAELPSVANDYYISQNTQYVCSTPTQWNVLADMSMQININLTQPVCQGQLAEVFIWVDGGFCLAVTNPYLGALMNASPYLEPCTYYYAFYNVADPNNDIFLYGGQNAYIYAAPANTPIRAVATDVMGDVDSTVFTAYSLVPANSTTLTFLPPVPSCANGTQSVLWEFTVSGVVNVVVPNPDGPGNITIYAIVGWEPLNVLAAALYNPNNPTDDLPQDCPLLQMNMTEYEVFVMCYGKNSTLDPMCAGCTSLPVAYEGAQGQTFYATSDGWWEAYAWVPSPYYDVEVGRYIYCRYALSVHIQVPSQPYLTVTNLRRILVNGTQCSGAQCAAIDINTYVDPNFPWYGPLLKLTSTPPFGSTVGVTAATPPAFSNVSHVVAMGQDYQFVLTLDSVFCPVTTSYQVNTEGPLILSARTTRSVCTSNTGTAILYALYNSDMYPAGTTAVVCMFWPGYYQEFFSFTLPMNAENPTALPFSPDFFVNENVTTFNQVSQGLQTVVIYDNCPTGVASGCEYGIPTCDSPSLIMNQETLQINPLLEYQIFQFTVAQFALEGGGIVISLDSAYYPPCYGGTCNFSFSVFDDIGEANTQYGPYVWYWYEPFTNRVLQQSPTCDQGGAPMNPGPPEVNFKVNVFNATVTIPTGSDYGFRQSGNYTFIVFGCNSGCQQPYVIDIAIVNPFDVVLSSSPARCYGQNGGLSVDINGATPFLPGTLYDQTYNPAYGDGYTEDNDVVVNSQYITYWTGPSHPNTYIRTRQPTQVLPGNYSVIVQDANNCTSPPVNVTVESPPPIVVYLSGVAVPCSTSPYATYEFVVAPGSGNGPPFAVEQNLTTVVAGQNISLEFVSALNKTVCFDVIDRLGCRTTQPICEVTPSPEPVSVQLQTFASCPAQATGRAIATSNNTNGTITCEWSSNGAVFSRASCTQTGLPPGVQLAVTMTTLNGCTGQAFGTIGVRPGIVISQIFRSTIGTFGGPCIDYANFSITGGIGGPNYTVFLIGDTYGANITYNNNYTALVVNMCRGVQYIIGATDSDGLCVQTYYSLDPSYTFGGNGTTVQYPLGLPPFVFSSGTDGTVAEVIIYDKQEEPPEREPNVWATLWLVPFFGLLAVIMLITIFALSSPANKPTQQRTSLGENMRRDRGVSGVRGVRW